MYGHLTRLRRSSTSMGSKCIGSGESVVSCLKSGNSRPAQRARDVRTSGLHGGERNPYHYEVRQVQISCHCPRSLHVDAAAAASAIPRAKTPPSAYERALFPSSDDFQERKQLYYPFTRQERRQPRRHAFAACPQVAQGALNTGYVLAHPSTRTCTACRPCGTTSPSSYRPSARAQCFKRGRVAAASAFYPNL